ncbi:prepilin-type N-terminal cleavage/methylation domain-containing protein [Thauera sp. AutoDN2]|uniref:prepilin-type N-terminal cleavage/methylation domain-containing protein n=1 Tax=Thauera sp. AutoDN2 TaxID=3416051 RepID=UPI003F4BC87F
MKNLVSRPRARQDGLTLVELMIAMLLGLVVVGGVGSVVIANGEAYRTNEGLSQTQDAIRTAFELVARDIREAGATGCGNSTVTNVLNGGGGDWLANWDGVRGYDAGTPLPAAFGIGNRVAGTDAILLQGIEGTGHNVVVHSTGVGGGAANFQINSPTTAINDGDILLVCDPTRAVIFQASNYNGANRTVVFNTGGSINPGNCSKYLNPPATPGACGGGEPNPPFEQNSQIAAMVATVWYIGDNGRPDEGSRSLFRRRIGGGGAEEIVPGISDMQLSYRPTDTATGFVTSPANWRNVTAVEITLTAVSTNDRVSVNNGRLQRTFTTVVGLRNRVP